MGQMYLSDVYVLTQLKMQIICWYIH